MQQIRDDIVVEKQPLAGATPDPSAAAPASGFQRMKARHHRLIGEHEALKIEYQKLLDQHAVRMVEHDALKLEHQQALADQASLKADIDQLLQRHAALMASLKPPKPISWFASANEALAKLAAAPEPMAIETMTVALAKLLQRVASIRTGAPV